MQTKSKGTKIHLAGVSISSTEGHLKHVPGRGSADYSRHAQMSHHSMSALALGNSSVVCKAKKRMTQVPPVPHHMDRPPAIHFTPRRKSATYGKSEVSVVLVPLPFSSFSCSWILVSISSCILGPPAAKVSFVNNLESLLWNHIRLS